MQASLWRASLRRHALKTTDTEDESEDDSKPAADKKDD
jgi:hypothetical protein